MNVAVDCGLRGLSSPRDGFDVVERKGTGHPDSLADIIAEAFSRRYSLLGSERFETVPTSSGAAVLPGPSCTANARGAAGPPTGRVAVRPAPAPCRMRVPRPSARRPRPTANPTLPTKDTEGKSIHEAVIVFGFPG